MRCLKCNQELNDNAMFCVHCGEKTALKYARYLRVTGIVSLVLVGIVTLMTVLMLFIMIDEMKEIEEELSRSIINIAFSISIIILIFNGCLSIVIINNSYNYEKASLLKKLSIAYAIVAALSGFFFIIPAILCIIFTSKLESIHLQKIFREQQERLQ